MKFQITILETVTVQRKIKYTVEAESEQEVLDTKGKSTQYLNIIDADENLGEIDIDAPIIKEILKSKVINNEITKIN